MKTPRQEIAVVNVGELEAKIKPGEQITPKLLSERGLVRPVNGKIPPVKLLGSGKLTKNLLVKDCEASASAKKKIEEAGGKIL